MTNRLNEIREFLTGGREEVERKNDLEYGQRIDDVLIESARLFGILEDALWNEKKVLPKHTRNSCIILWKCLKSHLSALQSWRSGYWSESSLPLRTFIESACIALYIHRNTPALADYKSGKKSLYGKALSEAYKVIPSLKGERELLSEAYVHPSLGSGIIEMNGERYSLVGEFSEENKVRYAFALYHLESTLHILGKIIEFMFIHRLDNPVYYEKIGNDQFQSKKMSAKQTQHLLDFVDLANETGIDLVKDDKHIKGVLGEMEHHVKKTC